MKTKTPGRRLLSIGSLLLLCQWSETALADDRVIYAPDTVGVDRIFMIALTAPTNAPDIHVVTPEAVAMFDHTRPPAQVDLRRFYFRALKPTPRAEIRFGAPDGEIVVPVEIWSFEDLRKFRTLKGVQLPRRWPLGKPLPELKAKQVFPTQTEPKTPDRETKDGWLAVSDDAIWAMQPDSTIPRWHWVNIQFGCPIHGPDIYRERAYYPWIHDASMPWRWKIKCPIGGEEYPSNDFATGDMTSGEFPDDGIGGGWVRDGKHYGFIAEIAQFYCRRMMAVAPECANHYSRSGDIRYAHKALVAFCRLAVEYAYLATMTQHRHRNSVAQVERFGQGRFDEGPFLSRSGFTTYPIEQPGQQVNHALAYDQIFPAIEQDSEIIPFLRKKGFDLKTHQGVRRFIEENLFSVWMQGAMDGATSSNEPFHQWGFVKMAEVLNYQAGADFMDWLYDGGGKMRVFVPNTFFRDGAPYESTGGYNGMHVSALGPIVEAIEHLRALRPEVYSETKYPALSKSRRYHNVFDFAMDTVTIDRAFPNIGDTGSFPAYQKRDKIAWQNGGPQAFEHAFRIFHDPKFAWALVHHPGWKPSADFPFTRQEIEREAAKWPDDWNDRSSLHDGYGVAILRGGQGDDKRALWMNYGHNRGHSQDDTLDIGLDAYQGTLLSHLGYPRNWGYWEHAWSSHDVARIFPYQTMTAQAQLFADAGPVHVAEARAIALNQPENNWQRRLLALVDVGPDQFYGVDFYRIAGGDEHWWAFHAQEGEFTTSGMKMTPQPGGTLAGADVPYGDAKWLKAQGCNYGTYGWSGVMFPFAHLYKIERGQPDGPWWADWKLKTGEDLHLRLTVIDAGGSEVNICDGTSPAGGQPYEMKWILLHNKGAQPVQTQVVSVIEPYRNQPIIREASPLKLSGDDETRFAAAGCTLRLAERTDIVLASADPTVERRAPGGLKFAGRFGFYSERDGVPLAMSLVGGTTLTKGQVGIQLDRPEYRARIIKVDRATETVTVSPAPPTPSAMVGAYVYVASPARRSSYKVLAARAVTNGVELRLDLDSLIGTGRVTGVEDYTVKTATPFVLQGFRHYLGARLVNAARGAEYRVTEISSGRAAQIDQRVHPGAKADTLSSEFSTDSWFEVYDYGTGDEVVWPYAVSVTRVERGRYRVVAPVPVKLSLPKGSQVE